MNRHEAYSLRNNLATTAAVLALAGLLAPGGSANSKPRNFQSFQKEPWLKGNNYIAGLDISVSTEQDPAKIGGEVFIFPETTKILRVVRGSVKNNHPSYKASVNNDGSAIQYGFEETPDVMSVEFIYPKYLKRFCIKAIERLFLTRPFFQKEKICWDSPK